MTIAQNASKACQTSGETTAKRPGREISRTCSNAIQFATLLVLALTLLFNSPVQGQDLSRLADGHEPARLRMRMWGIPDNHPLHARTFQETIENLDQAGLGFSAFQLLNSTGGLVSTQTYEFWREGSLLLYETRKLAEEAARSPEVVTPEVLATLRGQLKDHVQLYLESHEQMILDSRSADASRRIQPATRQNKDNQAVATVAAYMLGEFEDFDSLPLLLKVMQTPGGDYPPGHGVQPDGTPRKGARAVPPMLLFAIMHQLVWDYPEERLNERTRELWEAYRLETAELPRGEKRLVPAWNVISAKTSVDENLHLTPMPPRSVAMTLYPEELTKWESAAHELQPAALPYIEQLEALILALDLEDSDRNNESE